MYTPCGSYVLASMDLLVLYTCRRNWKILIHLGTILGWRILSMKKGELIDLSEYSVQSVVRRDAIPTASLTVTAYRKHIKADLLNSQPYF